MDALIALLGIEAWKPTLTALLLPPVPLLLLALVGARLILRHRGLGWMLLLLAMAMLWLFSLRGTAVVMRDQLLRPPPALNEAAVDALKQRVRRGEAVAVIILGGGRRGHAPEYGGMADLEPASLERLRYGLWLARRIGAPAGFSGGMGWELGGVRGSSTAEAELAARIAREEFGLPLRWVEPDSRDTHENAVFTATMLKRSNIRTVVVVTHAWHMPRALRRFEGAADTSMAVVPAPMGAVGLAGRATPDWLPSGEGLLENRRVLRELLAQVLGA
jgi:uncharacterized SAM-binding protein YcdF (DUF218 family)